MNDEFFTWCAARIAACKAEQQRLSAEGRGDEATHAAIRGNIYGIFQSVWTALKGDREKVLVRLESIPAAWRQHLAEAEKHGDAEAAYIERVKLDAAEDIRRFLTEGHHD